MKKIYFLLFATILFGFVWSNKASGQPGCEECFAPWRCSTFKTSVNCNGVLRNIEVTVCYYCYVTQPAIDARILSIRGIPIGNQCRELAQEAATKWLLDNGMKLCGNLPCQEGIKIFKIYYPICGDLVYYSNGNYDIFTNSECELKCYQVYEWCWCNCIPGDCYYPETCTEGIGYPKVHWRLISFPNQEGTGQCNYQSAKPGDTVQCQKFRSPCNPNEGFPP